MKTTLEPIDLSKLLARHANCWVALSADERHVIATAKHPQQALKKAHAKGERDPILVWAPKEHRAYIVETCAGLHRANTMERGTSFPT